MKIINIDKFKNQISIEIDDKTYGADVLTVEEYINRTIPAALDEARQKGATEYCKKAVDIITARSAIPVKSLMKLSLPQLEAILLALQGVDPNLLMEQPYGGDEKK